MKMKKAACLAAALTLLAGCMPVSPAPSGQGTASQRASAAASPTGSTAPQETGNLAALLPDKAGFRWQYSGFAEFAMTLSLKSIGQSGGDKVYAVEGSVADMSGGAEGSGDFSVKITYTVSPGVLKQKLEGKKALDASIPELELIRAPLAVGTKWQQNVKLEGQGITLDCEIAGMKTENERIVYSVAYRQRGSDYYELRDITEGLGVTSFQKLYKYEGGSEAIGYWLTTQETAVAAEGYKQWLPPLNREFTYFGLAEYGHKGKLSLLSSGETEDVYEYRGIYTDGRGDESKFALRYRVDLARGTVTEQVISNERGAAEVNSKLHNLVVLKFPLSKGSHWSHQAKLDGKAVTVQASVMEYDEAKGVVKVRYTAKGAAGYYNDTYIEERTFEKSWGMTGFSNLIPGDIGISPADAKDAAKLDEAIRQHSFGYSINKQAG